jgi:hypothetical protein
MCKQDRALARIVVLALSIACPAACGSARAGKGDKKEAGRIIGELKSQKNTSDGNNTAIEVLAPGETKARRYHVLYDPKIKGPIPSVLSAVRAARIGDVVELELVGSSHGPMIKTFKVFKRGAGATAQGDKKVDELLKERLATLKELVSVTKAAYQKGTGTFAEVSQATGLLLGAELELCASAKERIAVHEKVVALARDNERVTAKLHESGHAARTALLSARAARLEAEIALERARAHASR